MQVRGHIALATGPFIFLSALLCPAALAGEPYSTGALPAVDGLNAKVSAFGGAAGGQGLYGGEGSISVPLGYRYGLQIDGLLAGFDRDTDGSVTIGGTAAHLFWRDPSIGMLGAYGDYVRADASSGVDSWAGAAEAELYLGRFTLAGAVGVDAGNGGAATLRGSRLDIDTRFFDVAFLAYYPVDNLMLSVGHSYILGENAAFFEAEWGFGTGERMAAIYALGTLFEEGHGAVVGGLRFYFGQSDKTLIRRHREDDPNFNHRTRRLNIWKFPPRD
jgi:hypothetical protein